MGHDDLVPLSTSLFVPDRCILQRRLQGSSPGPLLFDQLSGLFEVDVPLKSESSGFVPVDSVFVERSVRARQIEHVLWMKDRVMILRTLVDSADSLATRANLGHMLLREASFAESVIPNERLSILSSEWPARTVLGQVVLRVADRTLLLFGFLPSLLMILLVDLSVQILPVLATVKQHVMAQHAVMVETLLDGTVAVDRGVVDTQADATSAQLRDEPFSFSNPDSDEVVTDVQLVFGFLAEHALSLVSWLPFLGFGLSLFLHRARCRTTLPFARRDSVGSVGRRFFPHDSSESEWRPFLQRKVLALSSSHVLGGLVQGLLKILRMNLVVADDQLLSSGLGGSSRHHDPDEVLLSNSFDSLLRLIDGLVVLVSRDLLRSDVLVKQRVMLPRPAGMATDSRSFESTLTLGSVRMNSLKALPAVPVRLDDVVPGIDRHAKETGAVLQQMP